MPKNLRIVITGATRGLGRAMCAGFIAEGHTVFGCGSSESGVAKLRKEFPDPHQFHAVDVRDDAAVGRWAKAVLADGGPPDLLLNNAAVISPNANLWEVSAEDFNNVVDVNVKGVYHVLRHFVPAMVERGRGVIVNFSSGWGRSASAEVAPYCASKFAIEGLTQSLAAELPAGMAAIPLNPGVINTEMLQSCFQEGASGYPTPEHWAIKAVPYILSLGAKDNGRQKTVPQ